MAFIYLPDLPEKELIPGYHVRFVHTDHMTLAYWTIEAGAALPAHSHPHEQVTSLLAGDFELTVDGEMRRLKPGSVAVIPGNTPHSAVAITACQVLDAFYPVREEYRK
jgi:quercetin dioxygenase-like cupin family protein